MPRRCSFFLLFASLAGCTQPDATRRERDVADPAIAMALANPMMTDPELLGPAHIDATRPPDRPYQALLPPGTPDPLRGDAAPTVVARMLPLMTGAGFAACDRSVRYSFGWATALPPKLGLTTDSRVAEAAGSDRTDCRLRLIAYDGDNSPEAVIDSYRRLAVAAGYRITESAQGRATLLRADGAGAAAFLVVAYPAKTGGSSVDFATNRGR